MVFGYNDYRNYLRDFFLKQKEESGGLSMRKHCEKAGVSVSLMSMVLSGERDLSDDALKKMMPVLKLQLDEKKYLRLLVAFDNEKNESKKEKYLSKLENCLLIAGKDLSAIKKYRYLSSWYCVAIRELAGMKSFNFDPVWVQSQLRSKVGVDEVKNALEFLIQNGYIASASDSPEGHRQKGKVIELRSNVYSRSLKTFHKQMLAQATVAIDTVPKNERLYLGHAFSVKSSKLEESKKILEDAILKLQEINKDEEDADSVYYVSALMFPLTLGAKK
ncbi:MAG: TIGR02147 family protein [Bdellovibrionaceae bacterium]|jgi:uncharacterized protein (TIGR02147 family)|nr:TIGR02147 family protein [Pseudobdellovibrionaceae bacterium]